MAFPFPNTWHLRRVADSSAKACYICYKPSTSVMITPDNKDYFYVCPSHLKDKNFCSPVVDSEDQAAKQKQEAMAREIEKVKKEYEEKQQKKKQKDKEKNSSDKSKDKNDDQSKKDDDADEKERDQKIESIKKSESDNPSTPPDDSPRVFTLHRNFYQMRIDRLRNAEAAKRNRQRMQDPSFFPSVPTKGI
ncbi:hypothetical protein FE257_009534 [Aspergillus nanangensis]|uniref:DUF1742-domain-containing protein n=1 Tax=Aspergillus nanangensis TaxID=2582783 RepID=A0AAD4CJU8_ASPNN|nr:hypothetical protein FE257_009534 [Aspergillus nanangensis]